VRGIEQAMTAAVEVQGAVSGTDGGSDLLGALWQVRSLHPLRCGDS
jgi:hypothetical protein